MRPRIKRPITRDGQDGLIKINTTAYAPRREEGRRQDGKFSENSRPAHRKSRPGQDRAQTPGKPGRSMTGHGKKQGKDSLPRHKDTKPAQVPDRMPVIKDNDGPVRLNKFIANSGICSRREADGYISAGLITVNGNVVTELGVKVLPEKDDVRFNGERLRGEKKVYVLLNKPKNYVTTTSDPHAEKNVMQLISKELCPERIFPVGRLDRTTTGILLLTNDGELAEKLTHPSYQKKKIYQVSLDKNVRQEDMDKLVEGVSLEDGPAYADEVAYNGNTHNVVGIEIHSGRNRIVRRMFEALGYKVRKLDRVYFAGLTKKNLRRGQWRFLSDEEVTMLKLNFYE